MKETTIRTAATLLLLFLGVNLLLTIYLWVPTGRLSRALLPLPETIIYFALLLTAAAHPRRRIALGIVVGVLLGFSVVEGAFQFIYARSFVPRTDIPMLSGLLFLLFGEIGRWAFVLRPAAFAAIVVLFVGIGLGVTGVVQRVVQRRRPERPLLLGAGAIAVVVLALAGLPPSLSAITTLSWLEDGRVEFVEVEPAGLTAAAELVTVAADRLAETAPAYRFPGLKDRDIFIFAIEAYGYATFSRPELRELIDPSRDALASVLQERGYRISSSYMLSPVAGGFSWLAEATLLTGQWIDSQNAFLQLYDAGLPTLTGMLHDGGYHTFTLKPGTVHSTWPEGWDLFRFAESMVAFDGDFGFNGPWFSYVPITDQYTLWAAHQRIGELRSPGGAAADKPLLAYYQLVSSHTPFNKIPPLIEPWLELGDGTIYNERADEIRTFDNSWGGGTQMIEGYSTGISYVFDVLTSYVEQHMDLSGSPVIILFGDHQAQRPIREQEAHLSVPIHIASRDPEILALFEREGFRPGLDGKQPPPHIPMSDFYPLFARVARGAQGSASEAAAVVPVTLPQ